MSVMQPTFDSASGDSGGANSGPATIEVRYSAQAADAAGVHAEKIDLTPGQTLEELLQALVRRHAGLGGLLAPAAGSSARPVLLFHNDQQIDPRHPPRLTPNDRLLILAPMAGG